MLCILCMCIIIIYYKLLTIFVQPPVVARSLTLISKSIQSLGNVGGPKVGTYMHLYNYIDEVIYNIIYIGGPKVR